MLEDSGRTMMIPITVLKTTAINGVNREWLRYDRKRGKCPFAPAAYAKRAEVKASPFAAPNVEQATPIGTIQDMLPSAFAPNVTATALNILVISDPKMAQKYSEIGPKWVKCDSH